MIVGEDLNHIKIVPKNIETIKLRRIGSVGRSAWIGAASGIVAGALVGLATNDEDEFLGDPQYSMTGGHRWIIHRNRSGYRNWVCEEKSGRKCR